MAYIEFQEILKQAKESFIEGDYGVAEPLLQQALLHNNRNPEVFQMLATLYYDKGQFNRAIKTFRKALEIDPTYTDASVGLSIILNDIGRYEEAKDVFNDAQERLSHSKKETDPFVEEKIALKHSELGDLYFQIERFDEALNQYLLAKRMLINPSLIVFKIVDCFIKNNMIHKAVSELTLYLREYPKHVEARLQLGNCLYQMDRVLEATEEWERVLTLDPNNSSATRYLQMARETRLTEIATEQEI